MAVAILDNLYDFCEPYRDKEDRIKFVMLPKGSARPVVKALEEIDSEEKALFNYYLSNSNAWNLPNDFTHEFMGNNRQDVQTNIMDAFKEVSEKIIKLYDKSAYFVDEADYAINCLFILSTYFKENIRFAPRLIIEGATSSGKGRIGSLLSELCYHGTSIGDGSYASCFRLINEMGITPIFSEFGDYTQQAKVQLYQMFKSGFDRNGKIIRCLSSTEDNQPVIYNVFTPMAIDIKDVSKLPEDVINRSFRIAMVENIGMKKIDKLYDIDKCAEIRTDLYRLKLLCTVRKKLDSDKSGTFSLDEHIRNSISILEDIDDNGCIRSVPGSGIRDGTPELISRPFNIASVYYPLSRLIGKEDNLITKLLSMQNVNRSKLNDTMESRIYNTWIYEVLKQHPRTIDGFITLALRISCKSIAECFQGNIYEEGTTDEDFKKVDTRKVRNVLNSLGFQTGYNGMPGHQTYVTRSPTLENMFYINTNKFCTEELLSEFLSLDFTNKETEVPAVKKYMKSGKTGA